jgi:hypothetical protein
LLIAGGTYRFEPALDAAPRFEAARDRLPRVRSLYAAATSSALAAPPSEPVSSTHGSLSNRGSDRKVAQPFSPSSPWPRIACLSRLDPSGVAESLQCSEASRLAPTTRSNPASA